jgi:hypothetical protein
MEENFRTEKALADFHKKEMSAVRRPVDKEIYRQNKAPEFLLYGVSDLLWAIDNLSHRHTSLDNYERLVSTHFKRNASTVIPANRILERRMQSR